MAGILAKRLGQSDSGAVAVRGHGLTLEFSLAFPIAADAIWAGYALTFGLTAVSLGAGAAIAGYRSSRQGKGFWNGFGEYIHDNWAQEAAITSALYIVSIGISLTKYAIANAVSKKSLSTTETVGRWMSVAEYEEMVKTGYVQEPLNGSGVIYVARPADANVFFKQAPIGSVYVEFDVPINTLKNTQNGWAKIIGPNSFDARIMIKKGLQPPTSMPNALNIKLIMVKR